MRRLVLVRHGESVWNAEARIQGQHCAGLSATGHDQVRAAATALAGQYPDARLVTSDLQRCRETAAPLAAALGRGCVEDPRLRERNFGAWEGRTRFEVERDDEERWLRWRAGEDVIAEIGGESASALVARVKPVFVDLLASTPSEGVTIAVTHGGPIWHGIHHLLGLVPPVLGGVDNASVTEVVAWERARRDEGLPADDDGTLVVLDRWNDVGHLIPGLRTGWRPREVAPADARPST